MNTNENLTKREYVCPMHPEVISDKPGNCPKCGMALEPRIVSLKEGFNAELTDMSQRFWISVILTIPLLIISMGVHIPVFSSLIQLIPPRLSSWIQFILATPVIFWCGWPLLTRG
ncbi:MAG TPA: heavy metal-binding domain-containing protein [Gammaproteobacteria bacterium]|nr:heavy metal-binding domain-containing protein [Gammaproteobacteria bacterium]